VKHPGARRGTERLVRLCAELGVQLKDTEANVLLRYLELVLDANRRVNLTRIDDYDDAVRLHLADSLVALPEVSAAPPGWLVDIGTGAGFPGVPLGVVTCRPTWVLDSTAKKVRAVQGILAEMELGARICARSGRAEEFSQSHPAEFVVVTARAVSTLPAIVELASPLLAVGGRLVALKGSPTEDELHSGRLAGEAVGMEQISCRQIELPEGGEARTIVSYLKARSSAISLPRRTGAAQRSPLA